MNNPTPKENIPFIKYIFQPRPIVDFFRAIIYILYGILMFQIPNFLTDLPLYKYLFCGASLFYGAYRIYRIYAEYKRQYR